MKEYKIEFITNDFEAESAVVNEKHLLGSTIKFGDAPYLSERIATAIMQKMIAHDEKINKGKHREKKSKLRYRIVCREVSDWEPMK